MPGAHPSGSGKRSSQGCCRWTGGCRARRSRGRLGSIPRWCRGSCAATFAADNAAGLHQVHRPTGLGEADAELALEHRCRAELVVTTSSIACRRSVEVVADLVSLCAAASAPVRRPGSVGDLDGRRGVRDASGLRISDHGVGLALADPGALNAQRLRRAHRQEQRSPCPMSFSAPGWSRTTRESVMDDVANAIRDGTLALIRPVTTSTEGRWVASTKMDAGRSGELGDADDGVLDVARGDHHEVGELVDDHQQVRVRLQSPTLRVGELPVASSRVEVVDVLEAVRGEVVVPQPRIHLLMQARHQARAQHLPRRGGRRQLRTRSPLPQYPRRGQTKPTTSATRLPPCTNREHADSCVVVRRGPARRGDSAWPARPSRPAATSVTRSRLRHQHHLRHQPSRRRRGRHPRPAAPGTDQVEERWRPAEHLVDAYPLGDVAR